MIHTFHISTSARCQMLDITADVEGFVKKGGTEHGMAIVFTPHTTAAVTINENADPDVCRDMLAGLDSIVHDLPAFRHAEGNSTAHIKSSLVGCSEQILIEGGRLLLGTWQGIYFCEFDGPRNRTVHVKIINE